MAYTDPYDPRAREARRKHYHANKDAYKARAAETKQELREYVRQLKSSTPCVDCKQQYEYYVMQFDHVSNDKVGNISRMINDGSRIKLLAEIAKCELICANCHAGRTWMRAHGPVA